MTCPAVGGVPAGSGSCGANACDACGACDTGVCGLCGKSEATGSRKAGIGVVRGAPCGWVEPTSINGTFGAGSAFGAGSVGRGIADDDSVFPNGSGKAEAAKDATTLDT